MLSISALAETPVGDSVVSRQKKAKKRSFRVRGMFGESLILDQIFLPL